MAERIANGNGILTPFLSRCPVARALICVWAGLLPAAGMADPATEPLRVGMELSYPPFEMTDPQGRPTGVSVRIAERWGGTLAAMS